MTKLSHPLGIETFASRPGVKDDECTWRGRRVEELDEHVFAGSACIVGFYTDAPCACPQVKPTLYCADHLRQAKERAKLNSDVRLERADGRAGRQAREQ